MASLLNENDGESKFPNPIIGKTIFLSSVRDFCPDGVELGIERVSKVFAVKQDPQKAQVMAEAMIMSPMKCRIHRRQPVETA